MKRERAVRVQLNISVPPEFTDHLDTICEKTHTSRARLVQESILARYPYGRTKIAKQVEPVEL